MFGIVFNKLIGKEKCCELVHSPVVQDYITTHKLHLHKEKELYIPGTFKPVKATVSTPPVWESLGKVSITLSLITAVYTLSLLHKGFTKPWTTIWSGHKFISTRTSINMYKSSAKGKIEQVVFHW